MKMKDKIEKTKSTICELDTSWIIFSRQSIDKNEHPRVITYINIRLIQSCFSCLERTL